MSYVNTALCKLNFSFFFAVNYGLKYFLGDYVNLKLCKLKVAVSLALIKIMQTCYAFSLVEIEKFYKIM